MQVQSLEAFGVHRDLLRAWEDNYNKELLPVQAEAVEDLGIDIAEDGFGGAVLAVTLQLTAQGEPTLVFVKDRRNSVRLCYRLAERVNLPPAQQAIEQLFILSPTPTRQHRAPARRNRISLLTGLHKIRHIWYTKPSGGRKCGCRSCVGPR